jgi:hypothetical protein
MDASLTQPSRDEDPGLRYVLFYVSVILMLNPPHSDKTILANRMRTSLSLSRLAFSQRFAFEEYPRFFECVFTFDVL